MAYFGPIRATARWLTPEILSSRSSALSACILWLVFSFFTSLRGKFITVRMHRLRQVVLRRCWHDCALVWDSCVHAHDLCRVGWTQLWGWHSSLDRRTHSSRATTGYRSHWAALVVARSLVSWHRRRNDNGFSSADGRVIFRMLSCPVPHSLVCVAAGHFY